MNNIGTWEHHIHGSEENPELLNQLSLRVRVLKRLKRHVPPGRFNILVNGLFMSKLVYGITVWSKAWGLSGVMDEDKRNSIGITNEDLQRIQIKQNKVMRLKTGLDRGASITTMCQKSDYLSIHQIYAYHIACKLLSVQCVQSPQA